MTDVLAAALYSIPADDREMWVRMGMAIKSELGEEGFDLWDRWSRQSESYEPADAKAVWRSCKPTGGITIASLYHEAKASGWQGEAPVAPQVDPVEQRRRIEDRAEADAKRRLRQQRQIGYARALIQKCEYGPHPYLLGEGVPRREGADCCRRSDYPDAALQDERGAVRPDDRRGGSQDLPEGSACFGGRVQDGSRR